MLEKVIQQKVGDYAKSKGWLVYPWASMQHSGVPDRIYINKRGFVMFIEFKQAGKKPTPIQYREITRLSAQNCCVYVVDSIERGEWLVDFYSDTLRCG